VTRRIAPWSGLLLGVALLVMAAVAATSTRYRPATSVGAVPRAAHPAYRHEQASAAWASAGVPVRLRIRALDVDAPVRAVGVGHDGALGVPENPRVLGWWSGSALPGQPRGSVVVDGHVDSARTGEGALFHLAQLVPGAQILVTTTAGTATYVVTARAIYARSSLPRQVFDQHGAARLVLLTCGGSFNRRTHHYDDNVVVFATPLPVKELS